MNHEYEILMWKDIPYMDHEFSKNIKYYMILCSSVCMRTVTLINVLVYINIYSELIRELNSVMRN